jgi:hypothetical protein
MNEEVTPGRSLLTALTALRVEQVATASLQQHGVNVIKLLTAATSWAAEFVACTAGMRNVWEA